MAHIDNTPLDETVIKEILKAIQTLRYGSVEIIVHEGRVTQIEKHEKVRFTLTQQRS
jgi:hypothetical protein